MLITGIDISGSEARIATIDTSTQPPSPACSATMKMALKNSEDAECVRQFYRDLVDFVTNYKIDRIAVKTRKKKGRFAGGPDSFKIEGLIQLCPCEVVLVSSTDISRRANHLPYPASLNKYQHDAFDAAATAME